MKHSKMHGVHFLYQPCPDLPPSMLCVCLRSTLRVTTFSLLAPPEPSSPGHLSLPRLLLKQDIGVSQYLWISHVTKQLTHSPAQLNQRLAWSHSTRPGSSTGPTPYEDQPSPGPTSDVHILSPSVAMATHLREERGEEGRSSSQHPCISVVMRVEHKEGVSWRNTGSQGGEPGLTLYFLLRAELIGPALRWGRDPRNGLVTDMEIDSHVT
ncbi:hypothetical protein CRUP_002039, partial [Coryphaenoides rupestris]